MQVTIDHKLRIPLSQLSPEMEGHLRDALEIPNLAREQARKMDQWGWQRMPAKIPLWERDSEDFIAPRGFLHDLAIGLADAGIEIELIEGRNRFHHTPIGAPIDLRRWQIGQVDHLLRHEQGILKAPAGSGKTVSVLAAIQASGVKALVIVNTKDILWQWKARTEQFLPDYPPVGQIGDGKFDVSEFLTIATAQTLHSRYDALEADGFFDSFSFVCLDECHHATASTYNRILNRFSSRYRVGVSATPDKTGDFALAQLVLGPIIHETRPKEVDSLQKPTVVKVLTNFQFGFRGHRNRWQRSNYGQMIDKLVNDPERNALILKMLVENRNRHQLVVTKRLEHIAILEDMILGAIDDVAVLTLTGQDSNEDRERTVAMAADGPCVILSTLADEALDIPRLDAIHLVFPQKNPGLITQQIGRVERKHEDKQDAVIFDYADMKVGPLEKQWRSRRFDVYEPRGYVIQTRNRND